MLKKVVVSILCLVILVFSIPVVFLALHPGAPEAPQNVDKTDKIEGICRSERTQIQQPHRCRWEPKSRWIPFRSISLRKTG